MTATISSTDFEFVSALVRTEAAITLEKGKEYLVQTRLEPVAKSLGFIDIGAFLNDLRKTKSRDLCKKVVESLTTHETSFFRDREPFEVLRETIIPKLIETQRQSKELTIWCGAASSGQEPYSLCILLNEHFPELRSWRVKLLATDISNAILKKAKEGIYTQLEVNRGLPVQMLVKNFDRNGQNWIVKPELRRLVDYFELNLLHPFTQIPPVDLVMMRNVLIYFDLETKKQILNKVRGVMKPHAYLFLGAAETTINIDENFERVPFDKTSCYKKK